MDDDDDHHMYGVRLLLWTANTNGPIIHIHGDIWVWITMVKWYRQRNNNSSTRALWQSYQQSHLVESGRNGRRKWWIWPWEVFCSYLQVIFTCHKVLRHGAAYFTSSPKEGVLQIFVALKNLSPRPGLNPRTLDLMARTLNITPPRATQANGSDSGSCPMAICGLSHSGVEP
jgi:hypothetical protein